MAEHRAATDHAYDPLWDAGRTTQRKGKWANLGISLSIAAHAGLVWYIYETKFVPHYKFYADDQAVTAQLISAVKPPPPPEPPKPEPVKQAPPPKPVITP